MDKKQLRKLIRERKSSYAPEELIRMSEQPLRKLTSLQQYKDSKTILLYNSLPDEVYTHTLIKSAAKEKTVILPVVEDDTLRLVRYTGNDSLNKGTYGILEPQGKDFTGHIDLALVPGMAFTPSGYRLGRGKGYYDRLLTHLDCLKIGICFDFQLLNDNELTIESHDIIMDLIIH